MNKLRFIPIFLAAISLLSCENEIDSGMEKGMGEIAIQLSTDDSFHITTKANGDIISIPTPSAEDFYIKIFDVNANNNIIKQGTYSTLKDKAVPVNEGSFRASADHGDPSSFGFGVEEYAYFSASQDFTLTAQEYKEVALTAKMTKVMMTVGYTINVKNAGYFNYYSVIKSTENEEVKLQFDSANEDAQGFIPAGSFNYAFHVQKSEGGEEKVFVVKGDDGQPLVLNYNPNQYVKFTIDLDGALFSATITTNDEIINVPLEEVVIDSDYGSKAAPIIELEGVSTFTHVGKTTPTLPEAMTAHIVADGLIQNAVLTINSDYLASKLGFTQVDLATADQPTRDKLIAAGIKMIPDEDPMFGVKFAMVDFAGAAANYTADGLMNDFSAAFNLKVTDQKQGNTPAEQDFDIKIAVFDASLIAPAAGDVWAKKAYNINGSVTSGNPAKMTAQYSKDGQTWNSIDGPLTFPINLTGLDGGSNYRMRIMHEYSETPIYETAATFFTTEAEAQLGNSGFEDYQLVQTTFSQQASSDFVRNWYLPYKSGETDPWWACNSMKSMPNNISSTSKNYKNFPSSGYVKDVHSGNKAAKLFCVNVGFWNTDGTVTGDTYNGEIWIGTADDSGNQATQGHSFTSRPSKLTFWYKYSDNSDKKFYVKTWIKDTNGNIIAESEEISGPAAADWTKYELPFTYKNNNAKAASIFVWIASSYQEGHVGKKVSFELGEETVTTHAGCFLTIDDIELIYE